MRSNRVTPQLREGALSLLGTLLLLSLALAPSTAATRSEEIASIRAQFVEATRAEEKFEAAPKELQRSLPSAYNVTLPLLKKPLDLLVEAIDLSVRHGDRPELTGAVGFYADLVDGRRISRNPSYLPILLDLTARDDLKNETYTGTLATALRLYPSRETVITFMNVDTRAQNLKVRSGFMLMAADMLGMDLEIGTKTTPLKEQRILAQFQSWFEKNKDRIQFTKDGEPRLRGPGEREDIKELSPEDRDRIRKDPVCVLPLTEAAKGDSYEGTAE